CAAEFDAATPYFYSTYEEENEAQPLAGKKAVILGSGPIRIGQGIEFDYCSVHAAWALESEEAASIIINSNPETVSTDFDTSARLYFEPLDAESVANVLENEAGPDGTGAAAPPAAVQFGGQTAINLTEALSRHGFSILGSTPESIDLAEDRRKFEEFMDRLGIPQPPGAGVTSVEEGLTVAKLVGYPVLVRPSYVLGGRAMEIAYTPVEFVRYVAVAAEVGQGKPLLIDKYLMGREVEVDAISDGEDVVIPGIMEHIERAGVHSGDSMSVYPGVTLTPEESQTVVDYAVRLGRALQIKGLLNVQYVVVSNGDGASPASTVYVLEVNPRASRTLPFLSKVTGVPMVKLATQVMMGKTLRQMGYKSGLLERKPLYAVKAPVWSMAKLGGVDTSLGPEMKSTGEVMGIDRSYRAALAKALLAAGLMLPPQGAVLVSIADRDKPEALGPVRRLASLGYRLYATEGTAATLEALGVPVEMVTKKLDQGYPNVVDIIVEGRVQGVVNTATGDRAPVRDGFEIRRAAVEKGIPCYTSLDTFRAAVETLAHGSSLTYDIRPLREYVEGKDASGSP
ncbi:MAG: carbamoyl-phosphate synthase large subunit, partial [Chloroflexi bacterium]|nr:carbamoyl-phosphate synthase large subunit [Chloroflexota bacterium]